MTPHYKFNTRKKQNHNGYWGFLFLISSVFLLSWLVVPEEKKYKWEQTQDEWLKFDKWQNITKNALSRSDLPAKDVSMIIDSLTYYQQDLYKQLNPQIKLQDSLNKKPK